MTAIPLRKRSERFSAPKRSSARSPANTSARIYALTVLQAAAESRLQSFMKKQWEIQPDGQAVLAKTRGKIKAEKDSFRGREFYTVTVGGEPYQWWESRRIENLETAKAVAFEVMEYERKTDRAETGA